VRRRRRRRRGRGRGRRRGGGGSALDKRRAANDQSKTSLQSEQFSERRR
jgi:hypothetical protein